MTNHKIISCFEYVSTEDTKTKPDTKTKQKKRQKVVPEADARRVVAIPDYCFLFGQDHERVRAVRVDDESRREIAALFKCT